MSEGKLQGEMPLLHSDGSVRIVEVRAVANVLPGKHCCSFCDITSKKQEESNLRRLAAIVRASHDAIYSTTTNGIVTSWNRGAEKLFGYSADEILGKSCELLIPPEKEDEYAGIRDWVKAGKQIDQLETLRFNRDGARIHVAVSKSPIIDRDGQVVGISVVGRDIGKRRDLEEQLRGAHRMEAVGQLASGVAHDFNNLLTVILGFCELLSANTRENEFAKNCLGEIHKAADRATSLARQLLAFSRKQVLSPVRFDLNEMIRGMHTMLKPLLGEHIHLTLKLAPDLKTINADQGQIEQVLLNLMVNARDAMVHGGDIVIETGNVEFTIDSIIVQAELRPGRYAMLSVTDNGHGMTEEVRKRIFEPFYTTKGVGKGTGLGLASSFGIVKQSGGHIVVSSEVGKGTTFKVYLPVVDSRLSSSSSSKLPQSFPVDPLAGSKTILFVEDEEPIRDMARFTLQQNGYRILEARNGKEAMAMLNGKEYTLDLLISDIVMPEMGGKKLAQQLFASHPRMKVVFISGYHDDFISTDELATLCDAFIQKPFSPISLLTKVHEILDNAPENRM